MAGHETSDSEAENQDVAPVTEEAHDPGQLGAGAAASGPSAAPSADEARKSADMIRREKITRNMSKDRYGKQANAVKPEAFGGNYDKAGVTPFKPDDNLKDRDLSANAIAGPPAGWKSRVVQELPSEDVDRNDPGHTYHVLDDKTVVSTSEPATVDPGTAAAANVKADEKGEETGKPNAETSGILAQIKAIKMQSVGRSTTTESRANIDGATSKLNELEAKAKRIEANGGHKNQVRRIQIEIDRARKNLDQVRKDNADPLKKQPKPAEGDAPADAKGKSLSERAKEATELKGTVAEKTLVKGDVALLSETHKDEPGMLGSTNTGSTNVLHAGGDVKAGLTIGEDGIDAEIGASGKATLVDVSEKWQWKVPFHLLGEEMAATLFLTAKGMVGAEGKAKLAANVAAFKPKEPKVDTAKLTAGVEAFAGAKITLGAGVALEWNKKKAATYQPKLKKSVNAMMSVIDGLYPGLGWLLEQMGGDEASLKVLQWLFDWGKQGTVSIFGIEGSGEASAGIGAKAAASIGLQGGKFDFQAQANATWGVGLGGKVKISVDVVEGPKFAVLALGELHEMAVEFAKEQIEKAIKAGLDIADSIWKWFTADDKAREAVDNGAHKVLGIRERAEMIKTMMAGSCTNADEDRIITILRYSLAKGDIHGVMGWVDQDDLLWALDGAQDGQARALLGI